MADAAEILIIGDPVLTRQVGARGRRRPRTSSVWPATWSKPSTPRPASAWPRPRSGVNKRLIVVDLSVGEDPDALHVLINPEIVCQGRARSICEEGCLSVPDIKEKVARPYSVVVRGLDLEGRPVEIEGEDLLARAFCHEIDHLDGILFVEKLSALKRTLIKKKLKKSAAAAKHA